MLQAIDWNEVAGVIAAAERPGASIGVALVGPHGERFGHNTNRRYRAASTVKIPLMIEIYRQVDRGERTLSDEYIVDDADRAQGSGVMLHLHAGARLSLNDLIYLMISISDNTGTNVLIDFAGMDAVNATMRELGMADSTLARKMRGRPAQGDEPENWATPDNYFTALQAILERRAASPESCDQMIAILEKQTNARRISRYLPEKEGIRWDSKMGSVAGVTNDVGLITTECGTLLLSVFCDGLPDQHVGEQVIGDISRAAMNATGIVEPLSTS